MTKAKDPQNTLNGSLFQAVEEANIQKTENLIAQGADVKAYNEAGETPLHTLIIKFLVFNNNGNPTPIINILDILLNAGADINAKEKKGQKRTILHWAADCKEPPLVDALLKRNANVNCLTNFQDTPLHFALNNYTVRAPKEEQYKTVELLLKYGADINAIDGAGLRPRTHDPELHQLLLEYNVPSLEKTSKEIGLNNLLTEFSHLFQRETTKKPQEIKSLKDLSAEAAIKIRYTTSSKEAYFQSLLKLPSSLRSTYPELEPHYVKLFIYKVDRILNRSAEAWNETDHQKEFGYLRNIKEALEGKTPYNSVHPVIQELDKACKQGYLSIFKDNMTPVRNQIVQAMKEYLHDKELYTKYAPSQSKEKDVGRR
jgi:ankyrin repeat protein